MLKSPLKYAGGKRTLVPRLLELYAPHRSRRLVEPFVGGMNVALGLQPTRALLCDVNPHLMNFWKHLSKGENFTIDMQNDEKFYYRCRESFNTLISLGWSQSSVGAELFYYLNRTGFNGLCRFNKSGKFNVPFGRYKTITYRRDFSEYLESLRSWDLACCRFDDVLPELDDWIYLDPPFHGTFTDYSAGGFDWADQEALAKKFSNHPGPVVASNAATPQILELYQDLGFKIEMLDSRRSIAANGNRNRAQEMLATKNV